MYTSQIFLCTFFPWYHNTKLTYSASASSLCIINLNKWTKEGNVLFNDALNTFYLLLYCVRHMVKDHSDREKGNLLLPHRLLFPINSKGCHTQDITYHSLCYTSHGTLAGTRNSSMGPPHGLIWRPIAPWANALTTELHLAT